MPTVTSAAQTPPLLPTVPPAIAVDVAASARAGRRSVGGMLTRGAVILGLWTLVALVTTQQQLFTMAHNGRAADWRPILLAGLSSCWLWALFTPPMAWLARRYPVERDTWTRMLPLHVAFALGFAAVDALTQYALPALFHPFPTPPPTLVVAFVRGLFVNLMCYVAVAAVAMAIDFARLYREREVAAAQLSAQLAAARLHALQSQLRPHFLFNTLNTIAEQVHTDPAGADRMLTRLGTLLRASFGAAETQEVPLREELEVLRSYVDIMAVRFRDRVTFAYDVEPAAEDARVPMLLLQPLVENALRHGVEPAEGGGRVEIAARRRGDLLELEVRDTGPGPRAAAATPRGPAREGVGLRNTRDRLRTLYGDAHAFALRPREGGGAVASVTIPFRR